MKIQCNVCESSEANVLCCADEAALCWACDQKVHAANKLASKHQRVPLCSSSSKMPKCDICQESVGYFFCIEDRALLCHKCDGAIHSANAFVSAHQRFLLTGVKAAVQSAEPCGASSSSGKSLSSEKVSVGESGLLSRNGTQMPLSGQCDNILQPQLGGLGNSPTNNFVYAGGSTAKSISQWPLDEYLGITGLDQNYDFMDSDSYKADSGKLGGSDSSHILRAGETEFDGGDDFFGQVPGAASWAVPDIPSPPTASGLNWPKTYHRRGVPDDAASVPDIISYSYNLPCRTNAKRRRGGL